MEIKQQIKQLRAQLQKAGYAYYVDNQTRLDTMIFSIPRTFTLLRRPYLLLFSTTVLLAAQAAPIYCLSTPQQANQRWEERDYKGAIEDFNEAIRLDPNDAYAYYNRGYARYELKDYQGAIEDFNQAIRLNPNYAIAYNNRGNARQELKDYQGAIEDYNQVIRLNPNYAIAYYNRGVARYSFKDYQGAIEDFRQAANLSLEQGNIEQYQNALNLLQQLRN